MKAGAAPNADFSRPLVVDSVPADGLAMTIEAEPAERAAVARAIGLAAVDSLQADYRIARRAGGRLEVEGEVVARIVQTCVVTLEPFASEVVAPVAVVFAPQKKATKGRPTPRGRAREAAPAPIAPPADGEVDPPDPIVDGRIDLGRLAVEFLTLSLDFYPRKPGVRFDDVVVDERDDRQPSAFAALERFKDRS